MPLSVGSRNVARMQPLFTVTSAGAATIVIPNLRCNSRDYLLIPKFTASVDGSTVTAATNIEAATVYNGANVESLLGTSSDFDTLIGTLGALYGYTTGTMRLNAKAGSARQLNHDWNGLIAGRYFRIWGGAYFPTTTGEVTSLTLTISAGVFVAGSKILVYDGGEA